MTDESRPVLQPSGPDAALRLTIRRNCSISPRALRLLLATMAGFAGLEMVALTAAFYCMSRHAGDYEKFVEEQGALKVEIRDAGSTHAYEFNPHWARLVVQKRGPRPRLALRSHGRELEIGRHLTDEGRLELAAVLGHRLSSYQKR